MTKNITITISEQSDPWYSEKDLAKGISAWIQGQLEDQRNKIEEKHGENSAFDFCVVWVEG